MRNIWKALGLDVAERILGLGNRKPGSPTVGCYDRMYWKYKLIDYPSAWFQAAAEYLSLLWMTPGTLFFKNHNIAAWCRDACRFTIDNLNKDGSCIEVYPHERSYCATSFVLGHLCGTFLSIPAGGLPPYQVRKMGAFLNDNYGGMVSNQIAAAALAQFRLGKLLKAEEFMDDGRKKLEKLYRNRGPEGCFDEYGGIDIGYLSITLSLLARIENEFPGTVNRSELKKSLNYMQRIINTDGTYDFTRTSRGTQFLYPFGLAFWESPVLKALAEGLNHGLVIRPSWLDDRYVTELAIDYLYLALWVDRKEKHEDNSS